MILFSEIQTLKISPHWRKGQGHFHPPRVLSLSLSTKESYLFCQHSISWVILSIQWQSLSRSTPTQKALHVLLLFCHWVFLHFKIHESGSHLDLDGPSLHSSPSLCRAPHWTTPWRQQLMRQVQVPPEKNLKSVWTILAVWLVTWKWKRARSIVERWAIQGFACRSNFFKSQKNILRTCLPEYILIW